MKEILRPLCPPLIWGCLKRLSGRVQSSSQASDTVVSETSSKLEHIDYYGNTSLYALEILKQNGLFSGLQLLSLGSRMAHLADYLALFSAIYHSTMVDVVLPVDPQILSTRW